MKERFINSSIGFISKYQECDDLKIKKLKYGLEGIYNVLTKLFVVLILAIITGTIVETSLFLLFYAGIKTFSFGIHAKSSIGCWIITILIYNIIPLAMKNFNCSNLLGYIIIGLSFLSILLWAPADTPKRPLIRRKNRIKCKILSLIIVFLYATIFLLNNNQAINNAIAYSLMIQSIMINPIIYKITNTRFNNYKYYKNGLN